MGSVSVYCELQPRADGVYWDGVIKGDTSMKTVLVSTYTHPIALGLRYVSSYLKSAGHDVEMIFMSSKRDTAEADFSPGAVEAFVERCRQAELIGMSLMTNTFYRACFLTETLRKARVKAPIIWGGTHATMAPGESLEVADMICVGEGEEPMLQLVERLEAGQDPTDVGSIGFRAAGPFGNAREVRNPVQPLTRPLDDYPFPDYELDTHRVIEGGQLVPARPGNLRGTLHRLRVETTRGCPYHCTFCNNTAWANMYRGKGSWVRQRSIDNVLAEIDKARSCFPTIEAVNIVDDLFFVRSEAEIDEFADKYRSRVNLPLELDAFPNTVTERKIAALARLPIALISMGIQSGSPDTLHNIYKRRTPLKKIVEAIDLFSRYRIRAEYHYIIGNPYEPDANLIETLRFAATHHKGRAILKIFPLALYPGTPLYDRARSDGLIGPRHEGAYRYMYSGKLRLLEHDYLSIWLRVVLHMRNVGVPRWLVHRLVGVVTNRFIRRCLDRKAFVPVALATYQVFRKVYKTLIYQPFIRPLKYLRRRPRQRGPHREDEAPLPRDLVGLERPSSGLSERSGAAGEKTRTWTTPISKPLAERRRPRRGPAFRHEGVRVMRPPIHSGLSASQTRGNAFQDVQSLPQRLFINEKWRIDLDRAAAHADGGEKHDALFDRPEHHLPRRFGQRLGCPGLGELNSPDQAR